MKTIRMIDRLRTQYEKYFIGQQAEIEKTPFQIMAGVLTTSGDIENHPPRTITINNPNKVLTATTNNQVIAVVPNKYHRRLFLSMRQVSTVISYDWALYFYRQKDVGSISKLGTDVALNLRWFMNVLSGTVNAVFDGVVPYGDDMRIEFRMDNNHATDTMEMITSFLFYDPVW